MNCGRRIFRTIIFPPVCILLLFPVQRWADNDFKVLLIRPQLLSGLSGYEETIGLVRDPFNLPAEQLIDQYQAKKGQRPELFVDFSLIAIVWNKQLPLAVINDKLVGVGDTVKGATVLEIAKETVTLERKKMYHTLHPKPLLLNWNDKSL